MIDRLPDLNDREELVTLLVLADLLTRRGEPGPLSRIWVPSGPKRGNLSKQKPVPRATPEQSEQ